MAATATKGLSLGQKSVFYWKKGWNDYPELMGSSVFYFIGLFGCFHLIYKDFTTNLGNKRYKQRIYVYRPDNPKVPHIRRFPDSPVVTRTPRELLDKVF